MIIWPRITNDMDYHSSEALNSIRSVVLGSSNTLISIYFKYYFRWIHMSLSLSKIDYCLFESPFPMNSAELKAMKDIDRQPFKAFLSIVSIKLTYVKTNDRP
jgi:hypothetical protein